MVNGSGSGSGGGGGGCGGGGSGGVGAVGCNKFVCLLVGPCRFYYCKNGKRI